MANMAAASRSLAFEAELNQVDKDFRQALTLIGLEGVPLWNTFFVHAPGTAEHLQECLQLAEELGAKGAKRRPGLHRPPNYEPAPENRPGQSFKGWPG